MQWCEIYEPSTVTDCLPVTAKMRRDLNNYVKQSLPKVAVIPKTVLCSDVRFMNQAQLLIVSLLQPTWEEIWTTTWNRVCPKWLLYLKLFCAVMWDLWTKHSYWLSPCYSQHEKRSEQLRETESAQSDCYTQWRTTGFDPGPHAWGKERHRGGKQCSFWILLVAYSSYKWWIILMVEKILWYRFWICIANCECFEAVIVGLSP